MTNAEKALKYVNDRNLYVVGRTKDFPDYEVVPYEIYETISRALRILDKIESGEMRKEPTKDPEHYCDPLEYYEYEESYNQCLDDLKGIK